MDGERFDNLTRLVTRIASRRGLLHVSAAGLAGVLAFPYTERSGSAAQRARKKHHGHKGKGKGKGKKRNQLTLNQFGCVDVGQPCRGDSSTCCSGICDGTKPKPGQPDLSRCVGHNQGICANGTNFCTASNSNTAVCNATSPPTAACFLTTGNGTFCGLADPFSATVNCKLCNRDSDCVAAGFPPGSACVVLTPASQICAAACPTTQNRACLPPGA